MPKLSEVIFQNLSDGFDNCTSVDDRSASRTKMRKMALSTEAARCPNRYAKGGPPKLHRTLVA